MGINCTLSFGDHFGSGRHAVQRYKSDAHEPPDVGLSSPGFREHPWFRYSVPLIPYIGFTVNPPVARFTHEN